MNTKRKLIAFNIGQALERSVGNAISGIDIKQADAVEQMRKAGIPISQRTNLGEVVGVQSFFSDPSSKLMDLDMIDVPGQDFSVMRRELTVGQFKEFVQKSGYKIEGNNAERLISLLANGEAEDPVTCINVEDCKAYVKWRNSQPGENINLIGDWQFSAMRLQVGDQVDLSFRNWELTSSLNIRGKLIVRWPGDNTIDIIRNPEERLPRLAVRFIGLKL